MAGMTFITAHLVEQIRDFRQCATATERDSPPRMRF